ncbi:MAG: PEP-CTERM sorting domain-containing protein [Aulosira sp. ZfuVER01]|nr:PEP-CTERM sorting domain-containing protein [Aulosira sp. ZfuVER01]MDZ7999067.1 PEP-CTERM sorting domain-containing protein [Aulosira sp. DedVER01a]MDZ8051209.1 PEP-CTERM sorting domain-containing protein [Aulosira sp. ZfuCHP01]
MTSATLFKKLSIATAGAVFIGMGMGGTAHAAAINFDSPTVDFTNGAWSLGFKFSTNKQVTVNQLGFYDDQKNDLTQTHDVGIFNDAGALLVSGTVKPGDTLDGWFRYTSVAQTILDAGKTFVIAATTGSENYTWNPNGFTVDPAINLINDIYKSSAALAFPTDGPDQVKGYFGPNFKTAESVPEPLTLGGTVLAGGIGLLIKKRKAASQQAKA